MHIKDTKKFEILNYVIWEEKSGLKGPKLISRKMLIELGKGKRKTAKK